MSHPDIIVFKAAQKEEEQTGFEHFYGKVFIQLLSIFGLGIKTLESYIKRAFA